MARIDDVLDKIQEIKNNIFDWNRDLDGVILRLQDLYFNAEIDHGNYYLTTLEQIWLLDAPKDKILSGENLHTLTDEERDWFYTYGKLEDNRPFGIANSTHWFINAREQYVRVLINRGSIKKFVSPKEDYGELYQIYNSSNLKNTPEWVEFKLTKLDDRYADLRNTIEKIMYIIEYGKTNNLNMHGLNRRIKYNTSIGWGNENALNHEHIIDDIYQETGRPEIIPIPQTHKKIDITREWELINLIKGVGFEEIKWPTSDDAMDKYTFNEDHEPIEFKTSKSGRKIYVDTNSITYAFSSRKDADNFLFSAIDYVNSDYSGIEATIHRGRTIKIETLEKHYFSNRWPMIDSIGKSEDQLKAESDHLEKTLTHYYVSVTKLHDTPVFKEEIWEMGIVYEVTNMYTFGYHN